MILFLDSGVGGAIYLERFRAEESGHETVYLADTAGFPYGERDPDWVKRRVCGLVEGVADRLPLTAVVLACNTASVVALAELRKRIDLPVVGTVPAVKPAAALTRTRRIALLATTRTAEDPYTRELVAQFARFARVQRLGLPELVRAAEAFRCSGDTAEVQTVIARDIRARLEPDVDTVVLACTHFVRFRPLVESELGSGVRVVDSLEGVVRRLIDVAPSCSDAARAEASKRSAPRWFHSGGGFSACRADPREWQYWNPGGSP